MFLISFAFRFSNFLSSKKNSENEESNANEVNDVNNDDENNDPKSLEKKPKGLVDSLSQYFTPGKNLIFFACVNCRKLLVSVLDFDFKNFNLYKYTKLNSIIKIKFFSSF